MAKRSSYQQRVIHNYYQNQGAILLQRLGDLVTDLYLAEGQARGEALEAGCPHAGEAQAAAGAGPARPGQRQSGPAGQAAQGTFREIVMSDEASTVDALLELNRRLLRSIAEGDWKTYQELCDPTLTAFEAESCGELVEGMDFHRFYFDRGGIQADTTSPSAPPTSACWATWPC